MANVDLPSIASYAAIAKSYDLSTGGIGSADSYLNAITRTSHPNMPIKLEEALMSISKDNRRIVKVYIVDPDVNVPVDRCLLYEGDQKMTELTDQELFFEIDIKTVLDNHNTYRTGLIDKSVKDRTETLEPVRIRDLKMTVVTIAQF